MSCAGLLVDWLRRKVRARVRDCGVPVPCYVECPECRLRIGCCPDCGGVAEASARVVLHRVLEHVGGVVIDWETV